MSRGVHPGTVPMGRERPGGTAPRVRRVLLRDGRCVRVRAIQPDDEARLAAFHRALSPAAVRNRFFDTHPSLSDAELHRFTHLEGEDRAALVALEEDRLVGVARYEPTAIRQRVELGLVVAEGYRHAGLGSILFDAVVELARQAGHRELEANVLCTNHAMLALLVASGLPRRLRRDGEVLTFVLAL